MTTALDEQACALVMIQWPNAFLDSEMQEALALMARLGNGAARPLRFVLVIKDGADAPSPHQRQGLLGIRRDLPDGLFASVTQSPAHRGTITALSWAEPTLADRHVAVTTFEEACSWLHQTSGKDSAVMTRLLAQAERNRRRMSSIRL
jgi:hypothetical protein